MVTLTSDMKRNAEEYARLSHDYTSRLHDFHSGGADIASDKMYEGKLGEEAFKYILMSHDIPFIVDQTGYDSADDYDFLVNGYRVDVKTRTQEYQIRTLEMVDQFHSKPKDIYVGVRLYREDDKAEIYGYITADNLKNANAPKSFGFKLNYWAYDYQMAPIEKLIDEWKS